MLLIDNFLIDASLSESHNRESEVTEFPVESGADFTDHIRQLPVEIEIEGIVSATPIGRVALLRDLDGGSGILPTEEALAHLERIFERRQPVTVQTDLQLYERMAMTSLQIPRDRETGKALRFTATFRQIRVITNQRIARRADPIGGGNQKLGPKPAGVDETHQMVYTLRRVPPPVIAFNPNTMIRVEDEKGNSGGVVYHRPFGFPLDRVTGGYILTSSAGDHFRAPKDGWADGVVYRRKYTRFPRGPVAMDKTLRITDSQRDAQVMGPEDLQRQWDDQQGRAWLEEMTKIPVPGGL